MKTVALAMLLLFSSVGPAAGSPYAVTSTLSNGTVVELDLLLADPSPSVERLELLLTWTGASTIPDHRVTVVAPFEDLTGSILLPPSAGHASLTATRLQATTFFFLDYSNATDTHDRVELVFTGYRSVQPPLQVILGAKPGPQSRPIVLHAPGTFLPEPRLWPVHLALVLALMRRRRSHSGPRNGRFSG